MHVVRTSWSLALAALGFAAALGWSARAAEPDAPPPPERLAGGLLDPRFSGTVLERGGKPRRLEAGEPVAFGVRLAPGGFGVWRAGESVRLAEALPVQDAQGGVWFEAEAPEQIDGGWPAGSEKIRAEADCSGGKYLELPLHASLPFRIEKAGTFVVYARLREGTDGDNRMYWGTEGGRRWLFSPKVEVKDGKGGKQGVWVWKKLHDDPLQLAPGDYRVNLQHFWKAEYDFDRFAVLPAEAKPPEELGPEGKTVRCDEGWILTEPLAAPDFMSLAVDPQEPRAGTYAFEASGDAGKSWIAADGPGGRAFSSTALPASEPVRFRIRFTRQPGGEGGVCAGVRCLAQPRGEAWLVLQNDFVRLILDARTGRLFRLTDVKLDRELLWPGRPISLFSVDLKKRGEPAWLRYDDARTFEVKLEGEKQTEVVKAREIAEGLGASTADATEGAKAQPARFVGAKAGDDKVDLEYLVEEDVRLRFRLKLDETGQMLWGAEVRNGHRELDAIRLEFPRFEALRMGGDGLDDMHLRLQTFGHARRAPGLSMLRNGKYPGGVALPWEDHYDARGGLGLIARDPLSTNLGFESNEEGHFGSTLGVALRKHDCVAARGGKAEWEYAVAVHPGDWHWVADRYREWAVKSFKRPPYPEWFAKSDGFYNHGFQNTGMKFKDMGRLADNARRIGLIHVQNWGQFTGPGGGCCGPYWQPSPRYGTLDEFKRGIADVQAKGCKIGFFFLHDRLDLFDALGSHIYGINPKSSYPPGTEFPSHEFFLKHQYVGNPDGQPSAYPLSEEQWAEYNRKVAAHEADPKEESAPRRWHPVDQSAPEWWEYMRHWAIDKYVEEWGADGHYYDVLGCGGARESYDLRKGHHGHGLWGVSKLGIPRATVESAKARGHKDYFLLMEGMCDTPGQWTAGMISGLYYRHSETMRYTWPDFVLFEGHSNSGHQRPLESLEPAFLNGNRFDVVYSNKEVWRLLHARARARDWIYRGRFLDTLGVESPAPARLFLRRERGAVGAAVTFLNRDGASGTVRLDANRVGRLARAFGMGTSGAIWPVELKHEGGTIAFEAPAERMAVVVLAEDASPEHGLLCDAQVRLEPEGAFLEYTAANLTAGRLRVEIAPVEAGALGAALKPAALECEPGSVARARVSLELPAGFMEPTPLAFETRLDGKPLGRFESIAFPLAMDASFELAGNEEQDVQAGRKGLRLDPSTGLQHRMVPLYLEPGRKYRVSFSYKRTGGAAKMNCANIWQRLEAQNETNTKRIELPEEGRWAKASAEFVCAPRYVCTDLYLYNWVSERTFWVDDIRVEDLGPAPVNP
ncbi:MAG: hypothetical protein M5U26_02650 [Planctomycetota bacterium]|nr:hypothetical protein [Planctomycetota bacterium]